MKNFYPLTLIVTLLLGVTSSLSAQQNLWRSDSAQSPVVHDDGSVTLRLYAPNAESVSATGDFINGGEVALTRR